MKQSKFEIAFERLKGSCKKLEEDPEYKALSIEGKITVWEIIVRSVKEDRPILEEELGALAFVRSN